MTLRGGIDKGSYPDSCQFSQKKKTQVQPKLHKINIFQPCMIFVS